MALPVWWGLGSSYHSIGFADIERSHRLGKKQGERHSRPIIVRFSSDRLRDRVIRCRSKLKRQSADHRDAIFINEDLTTRHAQLAFDARQLKKRHRVADTWTYNGKILIKDNHNNISDVKAADELVRYQ